MSNTKKWQVQLTLSVNIQIQIDFVIASRDNENSIIWYRENFSRGLKCYHFMGEKRETVAYMWFYRINSSAMWKIDVLKIRPKVSNNIDKKSSSSKLALQVVIFNTKCWLFFFFLVECKPDPWIQTYYMFRYVIIIATGVQWKVFIARTQCKLGVFMACVFGLIYFIAKVVACEKKV